MNTSEFVDALKREVRDAGVEDVLTILEDPPGRAPDQGLVEASKWYKSLDPGDKAMVRWVIKDSVDCAIWGFLCVVEGVRALDYDPKDSGEFELYWIKGDERILLNDFDGESLQELYNS